MWGLCPGPSPMGRVPLSEGCMRMAMTRCEVVDSAYLQSHTVVLQWPVALTGDRAGGPWGATAPSCRCRYSVPAPGYCAEA
jgi:hypothetical protein